MKINRFSLIEGAKEARGLAVIIDVFRAFSFECYLIQNNAERILPVASKELAYELKARNPAYILAGERNGRILPGFDFGNTPSGIADLNFAGKTIVHTTSAGTQGLENARNAAEIITGSLVNAGAIARYIEKSGYEEVSLVCMGDSGVSVAEEDELCADYIQDLLLKGERPGIQEEANALRFTAGKKFFDPALRDVFPIGDFALCTAVDRFDFILKYKRGDNGLGEIMPIKV